MFLLYYLFLAIIASNISNCYSQSANNNNNTEYPTLNDNFTYCLEYTWFGPEYDNFTQMNKTCDDYRDETRTGKNIPCASPLVISYDGTIPDKNYLWNNHKASVLCRKAENQECVTYTYWSNGLILNQTHMCARIRTTSKTTPYECNKQKIEGNEIELCICKQGPGFSHIPCNSNGILIKSFTSLIIMSILCNWIRNIKF